MRKVAFVALAALVLGALVFALKPDPSLKWRAERDAIQSEAEVAERAGHPWAGVYLAHLHSSPGDTLCLTPKGEYYGAQYDGWRLTRVGHGLGRAVFDAGRLSLLPSGLDGKDPSGRLSGHYRIVRWGDIRCLVRPEETSRFVHCMSRGDECKDFQPQCTRGYAYGEPDLPDELAKARREDPMLKPISVGSVTGPHKRTYGWSWRVEVNAGSKDGLNSQSRLYWSGSNEWVNMVSINEKTAVGDVQQSQEGGPRMAIPLKSGMKVARWKPLPVLRPLFIYPMAEMKP